MNTPDMVTHDRSAGFSLIEFMIAITVSLVILSALSAMFVANSRARLEIERANQQIENGRYAVMALTDDLQLAGYLSHFNVATATHPSAPTAKPDDPCPTSLAVLEPELLFHVLGYDNTSDACNDNGGTNLLADYKTGTDVLVVRRVDTCILGSANCSVPIDGAPYFQASLCATHLNASGTEHFRLNTDTSSTTMNRTLRNCTGFAPLRRLLVHVYFVTNNDLVGGSDAKDCDGDGVADGDCIPTLKRAELTAEDGDIQYKAYSIANGIEDLQLEYGLDTDTDGTPELFTAAPDVYAPSGTPVANCGDHQPQCANNWRNVVSVKASLLARNLDESRNHVDTKVYTLGLNAAGSPQCAKDDDADGGCEAFGDAYKRHVYQSAIRLNNAAGRRE